ncbi:AH domain-containing protein [Aphelenchoides bicaudatus]|nr:AH domain-containing protein [Aphelenchoides bicaudatus]
MMSEEASGNVFSRDEEPSATSNKSPTPVDNNLNSPTERRSSADQEARTVVCGTNQEMAQIAQKVEKLKNWTATKFRQSKQSVLEQFNKAEKTVDTDYDQRITNLNDLHNRYGDVLKASTAYLTNFNAWNASQKQLAESLYQLSLREQDMKEKLNDQNEAIRQINQNAEDFSKQLAYFVSSLDTLVNKTIKDTLLTVQICESARLEFDGQRHEIHLLQQSPQSSGAQVELLNQKCEALKQKYEQLKEDVRVKLALLDENRLKVVRNQLETFENSLKNYFSESIKALAQNSPKTEVSDSFVRGVRGSSSFLEQ